MNRPTDQPPVSAARVWWRRLYWLRRDRPHLRLLPRNGTSVYVGFGGIGDELLATGAVHQLSLGLGRPLVVFARHEPLFRANPDVLEVKPATHGLPETAERWGIDLRRPCEWQTDLDEDRQAPPIRHIIAEAAFAAGVRGPMPLRPYLHLTDAERTRSAEGLRSDRPLIALQSTGASARFYFANKEWGAERFAEVARLLAPRFHLVQLGAAGDPLLPHVIDRRGLPDLRQSAALLAHCHLFVGQVGFLMHLARAVERRSVIVFGGREHPAQSGYPCNENLHETPPCSPCWQKSRCDFDRVCLSRITPAAVVAAVDRLLPRLSQSLETAEATL